MGIKVGIYPGGPTPRSGPCPDPTLRRRFQSIDEIETAQGVRFIRKVELARWYRQVLWVLLAASIAILTGLRLGARDRPPGAPATGPDALAPTQFSGP